VAEHFEAENAVEKREHAKIDLFSKSFLRKENQIKQLTN